ncbi:MAG: type III secretion system needle filament subunit SctF [Paludibacterium sp.]|uniref:type III secretion system needle filament subunit SctF n=1 Tax=Paludibacterium sp. TaxID=1917523 RepID=UPI0025EACF4F|nr:type III secretion system needle filament subunit SctF [Paludibacterium sp.]MBV8047529.1 type III secretion system needle filament subunit SctF [Paludibacterium sp.]MBV8649598.1 type III secretion system needle filament subunit SctF [Paludibacterium sp.]
MNLDAIVSQMNSQVMQTENALQAVMSTNTTNNPTAMLQMQYALQQYAMMVNYESTVMKTMKDMMTGILAKM